jgi:hypothetical protein
MKRIINILLATGIIFCFYHIPAYSWIYVDMSQIPGFPQDRYMDITYQLNSTLSGNAKNYPGAFALANIGGYPVGDAYLGDFPHMFVGLAGSLGCGNLKHYDETIPRQKNVYPAFAPNAALYFGFGIERGFDILIKAMIYSSAIYRPPLDQKSAKLDKLNFYSVGAKVRKNIFDKITIIPQIFNFGGFTISAGLDCMNGIIGIKGQYNYSLGTYNVPPYGEIPLTLEAYYNFNLKWLMLAANTQALIFIDFLWIFDLYFGLGAAATYGTLDLEGSGIGPVTFPNIANPLIPTTIGNTFAIARYHYHPRFFMGLFIAGLELNLWILKLNLETMVNLSNGKDINVQLGTRVQF